jgi:hypothetical protein
VQEGFDLCIMDGKPKYIPQHHADDDHFPAVVDQPERFLDEQPEVNSDLAGVDEYPEERKDRRQKQQVDGNVSKRLRTFPIRPSEQCREYHACNGEDGQFPDILQSQVERRGEIEIARDTPADVLVQLEGIVCEEVGENRQP